MQGSFPTGGNFGAGGGFPPQQQHSQGPVSFQGSEGGNRRAPSSFQAGGFVSHSAFAPQIYGTGAGAAFGGAYSPFPQQPQQQPQQPQYFPQQQVPQMAFANVGPIGGGGGFINDSNTFLLQHHGIAGAPPTLIPRTPVTGPTGFGSAPPTQFFPQQQQQPQYPGVPNSFYPQQFQQQQQQQTAFAPPTAYGGAGGGQYATTVAAVNHTNAVPVTPGLKAQFATQVEQRPKRLVQPTPYYYPPFPGSKPVKLQLNPGPTDYKKWRKMCSALSTFQDSPMAKPTWW